MNTFFLNYNQGSKHNARTATCVPIHYQVNQNSCKSQKCNNFCATTLKNSYFLKKKRNYV